MATQKSGSRQGAKHFREKRRPLGRGASAGLLDWLLIVWSRAKDQVPGLKVKPPTENSRFVADPASVHFSVVMPIGKGGVTIIAFCGAATLSVRDLNGKRAPHNERQCIS